MTPAQPVLWEEAKRPPRKWQAQALPLKVQLRLFGQLKINTPRRSTIHTAGLLRLERQNGAHACRIHHTDRADFLGHDVHHVTRFAGVCGRDDSACNG